MYGKELKYQRESMNLSQKELAQKTNLSQGAISYWENDERIPNIIACVTLADFYGITIDELIGREKPRHKSIIYNQSIHNGDNIIK